MSEAKEWPKRVMASLEDNAHPPAPDHSKSAEVAQAGVLRRVDGHAKVDTAFDPARHAENRQARAQSVGDFRMRGD